jgi:hypothetical protein
MVQRALSTVSSSVCKIIVLDPDPGIVLNSDQDQNFLWKNLNTFTVEHCEKNHANLSHIKIQ